MVDALLCEPSGCIASLKACVATDYPHIRARRTSKMAGTQKIFCSP